MANAVENNLHCSGCGVCASVCPKNAIQIKLSKEGFYTANLDKSKCVNCGLCVKVCPKFIEETKIDFTKFPLYAVWSNNKKEQESSSSGAIAYELALWGFENGYKIAGVIYDNTIQKAQTILAKTKEDLILFKGSKYLQSFSADVVKEILSLNDKVMFFGTPCQCAGLRLLANQKGKKDLILVDFFCHGVPSYLIWDRFIPKNTKKVSFRSKVNGWHNYSMVLDDIVINQKKNPFYTLFFSDLLLGDACYTCKAKNNFNYADFRLGDFWGSTFDNREDGVSAVCAISKKAQEILDLLIKNNKITAIKQNHKVCFGAQAAFRKTPKNIDFRNKLFNAFYEGKTTKEVAKIYYNNLPLKKKMFIKMKQLLPSCIKNKVHYFYSKMKGR